MRSAEAQFVNADSRNLEGIPDGYYHTGITSPPYFGLRIYGEDGREIGREQTPEEYVKQIVAVGREMWRVLRDDGTFWMNIGDTYATGKLSKGLKTKDLIGIPWMVAAALRADGWYLRQEIIWAKAISFGDRHASNMRQAVLRAAIQQGLPRKRAERVADVVEPQIGACFPQSVQDRCTPSHEMLFMFSKLPKYFYDVEAVKVKGTAWGQRSTRNKDAWKSQTGGTGLAPHSGILDNDYSEKGRNLRSVWTIATEPQAGEHYAAYPTRLVKPCIEAATSEKGCCPVCGAQAVRIVKKTKLRRQRGAEFTKRDGAEGTGNSCSNNVDGVSSKTIGWRAGCDCQGIYPEGLQPCRVIDPFGGSGTTLIAANDLGRDCTIVDLFPKYLQLAEDRFKRHLVNRAARLEGRKIVSADAKQMDLFGDDDQPIDSEPLPEEKPLQFEMFAEQSNDKDASTADHSQAPDGSTALAVDA